MPEPSKLAEALAKVQAELKPIKRTSRGQAGNRPHNYSGLDAVSEAVLPLLAANGLSFSAKPTMHPDHGFVLAYVLRHTSGEEDPGYWPLNASANAQGRGSEITYARRYCLCAITGATPVGEDDDGAAASQAPQRPRQRRVQTAHDDPEHRALARPSAAERAAPPADRTQGPIPDEANLWQDQPPPARNGNGHVGLIVQHFERLGVTDRGVRLGYTASLTGHAVNSTSELSADEQKQLLDVLSKCRNQAALDQQSKQEVST